MIFTNNDYTTDYNHINLSIIKLTNSYLEWYGFSKSVKEKLYKEIYDKFIERLQVVGIYIITSMCLKVLRMDNRISF